MLKGFQGFGVQCSAFYIGKEVVHTFTAGVNYITCRFQHPEHVGSYEQINVVYRVVEGGNHEAGIIIAINGTEDKCRATVFGQLNNMGGVNSAMVRVRNILLK